MTTKKKTDRRLEPGDFVPSGMSFQITNIGGIEKTEFTLTPGVNVLRGANAVGKTSAMRAVVRAQGGKQALERRDGTERGTVTGPGVSLTVRKVVQATGAAELQLADVGPLARLIDPGLKNTDAAARERIRALAELLDLQVDDDSLQALSPGAEIEWLRNEINLESVDDLLTASEKLKGRYHALARENEAFADANDLTLKIAGEKCSEIAKEITDRRDVFELGSATVDEAAALLDEGIREHERLIGRGEEREALERKQEQIRDTMGLRPPVGDYHEKKDSLEIAYREATTADFSSREHVEAKIRELDSAQAEQREGEFALNSITERYADAKHELEQANLRGDQWDRSQAILSEPLEGPLPAELDAFKAELVDGRRDALWLATQSAEYRRQQLAAADAKRLRDTQQENSDLMRGLAAEIPERLGEILQRAGAGLTVVDGRLHEAGESPRDFEHRLSTGERVSLALDVAAIAYEGKVLPLDGEFWAALDPENRSMFVTKAMERGLYVLTEEPTGGDLRLENEPGIRGREVSRG